MADDQMLMVRHMQVNPDLYLLDHAQEFIVTGYKYALARHLNNLSISPQLGFYILHNNNVVRDSAIFHGSNKQRNI
ncbi:hypothetical protein EON65_13460 [archaeon]|nr:MAG: hypothetical protein EON65_13460 [archaeon]